MWDGGWEVEVGVGLGGGGGGVFAFYPHTLVCDFSKWFISFENVRLSVLAKSIITKKKVYLEF